MTAVRTLVGTKEENLDQGRKLVEAKEYDKAISLYNDWHDLLPADVAILKERRAAFLKKGDFAAAMKDFEAINEIEKNKFVDLYVGRFFDSYAQGRLSAQTDNREQLHKELSEIAKMVFLARQHFDKGEYLQAIDKFTFVHSTMGWRGDRDVRYLAALAVIRSKNEDAYPGAQIALFDLVKEMAQDDIRSDEIRKILATYHFALGRLYVLKGKLDVARAQFQVGIGYDNYFFKYGNQDAVTQVSDSDKEAAFAIAKQLEYNNEDYVKEKTAEINEFKEMKGNHEKLKVLFKQRARIYRDHRQYVKALGDIAFAKWFHEMPHGERSHRFKFFFQCDEFARDTLIDMLEGKAAFYTQYKLCLHENCIRQSPEASFVLSERQRKVRFTKLILEKCDILFTDKDSKDAQAVEGHQKRIDFLLWVIRHLPPDEKNALVDVTPEAEKKLYLKLGKAYCDKNRFMEAMSHYKQAIKKWPDDNAFMRALASAAEARDQALRNGTELQMPLITNSRMMMATLQTFGPAWAEEGQPSNDKKDAPAKEAKVAKKEKPKKAKVAKEEAPKKAKDPKKEEPPKVDGTQFFKEKREKELQEKETRRRQQNQKKAARKKEKKPITSRTQAKAQQQEKRLQEKMARRQSMRTAILSYADWLRKMRQGEENEKKAQADAKQAFDELIKRKKAYREEKVQSQQKAEEEKAKEKRRAAAPWGDMHSLPIVEKKPEAIKPYEYQLLDELEKSGEFAIAVTCGSAILKDLDSKLPFDPNDMDFCTPISAESIKSSTEQFGIKPILIPLDEKTTVESNDLFQTRVRLIKNSNVYATLKMQVRCSPHKKYEDDILHRDFTIFGITRDKFGNYRDATGRGLQDLRDRKLDTIISPAASFEKDPYRTLRGGWILRCGFEPKTPDLMVQMEKFAGEIPNLGERIYYVHSWMSSRFSAKEASIERARKSFDFLLHEFENPVTHHKWNFLSKLFGEENAKKIMQAKEWIFHELSINQPHMIEYNRDDRARKTMHGRPVVITQIYMLFFVAIAKNTPDYQHERDKETIFEKCPLLKTVRNRYSVTFDPMYEEYQACFELHRKAQPKPNNPQIPWNHFRPAGQQNGGQHAVMHANGVTQQMGPPKI